VAPPTPPGLLERFSQLEARVVELERLNDGAVERELKWAEMNAQLRRFLGRLDAHAARAQPEAVTNGARGGPRPDVLAVKFPHGLPTKE